MNVLGNIHIDGIASNATAYGSERIDCRNLTNIRFQVKGVETSTPVGKFEFYGTEDAKLVREEKDKGIALSASTAQWTLLNLPAAAVHGSGFTAVTDGDDHVSWDGTTPLNMLVMLNDPPAAMYVKWVHSSGGSASTGKITVRANGRYQE